MDHVLLASRESKKERDFQIQSLFNFFNSTNLGYFEYALIHDGLFALQIPLEYKYAQDLLRYVIPSLTIKRCCFFHLNHLYML